MESGTTTTILGGTGFVGTHLINRLLKDGYQVRVLSRRPQRHTHLSMNSDVELVKCDVFNPTELRSKLKDSDIVINLIGILNQSRKQNFRRTHIALPGKLVEINRQLGIRRFIHLSALNASASAPSNYLKSKGEGEDLIHTSSGGDLKTTSFRPSVIFGAGDSFLNRFASLLKFTPRPFPLACAQSKFAPVYVGDVVDAIVNAFDDETTFGKRIDLCGPKEYSLKELITLTAENIGKQKTVVGLPRWLSFLQAAVLGILPGKLFTLDNYRSMKVDSVCKQPSTCSTALETIAPQYLGNTDHNANMQKYRENYARFPYVD